MAGNQPVVIKKVKKVVGGGHHGGAWKVAYADFVTAMMAFFLLMWLVNATSPEQKRGIADYFAPASVSMTTSGAGGILAGTALATEGARNGEGAPVSNQVSSAGAEGDAEGQGASDKQTEPSEAALDRARAMREDTDFDRAEMAIRQAIQDMPDVAELSKHLILDRTPEGMRIQLVDQEGRSMFAEGAAEPNERARRLLAAVARSLQSLPNRVTISGHTATGGNLRSGESGWDLSADRANAARRILQAEGVGIDRIFSVSGKADSDPLFPDDPTLAGNRRVAITLLREASALPSDVRL
jgi:chemotaxis protein MotB